MTSKYLCKFNIHFSNIHDVFVKTTNLSINITELPLEFTFLLNVVFCKFGRYFCNVSQQIFYAYKKAVIFTGISVKFRKI